MASHLVASPLTFQSTTHYSRLDAIENARYADQISSKIKCH